MRRRHRTQLVVVAGHVLATPSFSAEQALSIPVIPRMAGAPANVSITVTVKPNEKNRTLVVEDDSENYYRSSEVPLERERAARMHVLVFRELPPGQHPISAVVRDTNGPRARVSTTVPVTGPELSQ